MKKQTYDWNYFYKKYSKLPEKLFCTFAFIDNDKCCAQGWCGTRNLSEITEENARLRDIFSTLTVTYSRKRTEISLRSSAISLPLSYFHYHEGYVAQRDDVVGFVNNGMCHEYIQKTPKQRLLAALRDIKKAQQPKSVTKSTAFDFIAPEEPVPAEKITVFYNTIPTTPLIKGLAECKYELS